MTRTEELIERCEATGINNPLPWEVARQVADALKAQTGEIERLKGLLCTHEAAVQMMGDYGRFLKDGETVEQCIDRNRKDAIAVTGLLADSRADNEQLREALKVRSKQIGVACENHDLIHSLECGICAKELREQLVTSQRYAEQLRGYVRHEMGCKGLPRANYSGCTCGLLEALALFARRAP